MKNKLIFLLLLITKIVFGQSTTPNISKVLSVSSASQITAAQSTLGIGSSTVYATSPLSASSGTVSLTGVIPVANGGTNNTINASNYSIVTKDSTTDAVMYPFFGTATSGNLLVKNSGLNLNFIPKNAQLGLGISPKSIYRVENNELYGMSMRTTKDTNFIFAIQHDGNGSNSFATFRAINNLHYVADWGMINSSAAEVGIQLRNMAGLYTNSPIGMCIMAQSGYIDFAAGSASLGMRLSSTGLGIGRAPTANLDIYSSTNGGTFQTINNPNAGALAQVYTLYKTDASGGLYVGAYSTAHAAYGSIVGGSAYVLADQQHLTLMAGTSGKYIKFASGGTTERIRLNENGGFVLIGGNIYMKDSVTPFNYWKGVMTSGTLIWTDTGSTTIPTTQ